MKKHVLIIPSFYHTKDNPTLGTFFKEQSEALLDEDLNVNILYPERRSIKSISIKGLRDFHFQVKNYNEKGINIYRMHSWNLIPTKFYIGNVFWVKYCLRLFKIYIKANGIPDLIHAHCALWGGYVAAIIKQRYGVPYVITEHSSLFLQGNYSVTEQKKAKLAFNDAEKVIAVSNSFARVLNKEIIPYKSIEVIPNFINTDFFYNNDKQRNDEFIFITACFLKKNKKVDRLIEAFARQFKGDDNIKLHIVGDGEERNYLEILAKQFQIENQVKFLGLANREQLKHYLSQSNCFVMPSEMETFGVVLIEAMSMGLPLISTKCGGPEDIIFTKEVGLLCEKNPSSLANSMKEVYSSYARFNSENIRNYCIDKFSNKNTTKSILSLYNEVINKIDKIS